MTDSSGEKLEKGEYRLSLQSLQKWIANDTV